MKKRFLPYIILIAANAFLIVYSVFYGIPQSVERVIKSAFLVIFILLIVFGILSYLEPTLTKGFNWFKSFLRVYSKVVTVLGLIILTHLIFATIYYQIYLGDPEKFKFDDQIRDQKVAEVENTVNESISKIMTEKQTLEQHLGNLDYIIASLEEYEAHSDLDSIWKHQKMLVTDSVFFLFEDTFLPPGTDPEFNVEAFDSNGVLSYTYGFKLKHDDQVLDRQHYYFESIELARAELLSDFNLKNEEVLKLSEKQRTWTFLDFVYFSMRNLNGEVQPNNSQLRMVSMFQLFVNFFIYLIIPGYIFSKRSKLD